MFQLARLTYADFQRHKSPWLAAAIAYFSVFAIAPLIIVVVEIVGIFLGDHEATLKSIYEQLGQTAGPAASQGIQAVVTTTFAQRRIGLLAQTVSWAVFVFAAIGLFGSIQEALNSIWEVPPRASGILGALRDRAVSFCLVLVVAFLLLVFLGANAALTATGTALSHALPFFPVVKIAGFVLTFVLTTLLFAVLFKYLPDRAIRWRDVWIGASISALLFTIGQFSLGWYLGRFAATSSFGSFGGIVAFLVWVYYSAQIFLLGAELTHVVSTRTS